MAINQPEINWN